MPFITHICPPPPPTPPTHIHTNTHISTHTRTHFLPQLSSKSQRILSLEVELSSARAATERASSDLAGSNAEKGRLHVEVMSLTKLRDSA